MGNLDIKKFRELLKKSPMYKELRENEMIKDRIHLLCLSGSHAYGTSRPESDIDIRGIVGLDKIYASDAVKDWGTLELSSTDTVIHSYKKAIMLIMKGNPDILAYVGQEEDDYLYLSKLGRTLVRNHSDLLGALPVYNSFIGYSNAQLRRLQLAELGRLEDNEFTKETKLNILRNASSNLFANMEGLNSDNCGLDFDILDDNVIFNNLNLSKVSIDDAFELVKHFKNISSSFGTKGKRNTKKTDFKLNKHCMHTIRGILMGIDTLKEGKVTTYRRKDLPLLTSILNGDYMNADGSMNSSFYELLDTLQKKAEYAYKHTVLPEKPDIKKVSELYASFTLDSLLF